MLFDSSIRKELARSFGATAVVLITVVMTMMLIRTLGQAYKGSVSPSDVMLVMGFTVLGQMSTILTLSLFVAVVGTRAEDFGKTAGSVGQGFKISGAVAGGIGVHNGSCGWSKRNARETSLRLLR